MMRINPNDRKVNTDIVRLIVECGEIEACPSKALDNGPLDVLQCKTIEAPVGIVKRF